MSCETVSDPKLGNQGRTFVYLCWCERILLEVTELPSVSPAALHERSVDKVIRVDELARTINMRKRGIWLATTVRPSSAGSTNGILVLRPQRLCRNL